MTGTSIVVSRQELDNLAELGHALRDSGYFEEKLSIAQAAVKVLAGRELGLGPVASMRSLHIVEGKIEMSADLLAQRVKQHPSYDYRVRRLDTEACELIFFENGEAVGVSEFTMGDAENAQLLGRKSRTWEKYPRNMLFNRALTNGVAWYCPDVAAGGAILVEGGVTIDTDTGEVVEASDELEPAVSFGDVQSHSGGMGESDGSSANAENTGADAGDPTSGPFAYGEGADDPEESDVATKAHNLGGRTASDSSNVEGTPTPDAAHDVVSPPGSEGASASVGDLPDRAEEGQSSADAGGERKVEAAGPRHDPPPPATRALTSQVNQLLRLATSMRWDDGDITRELGESYPGVVSMANLTQEQARELIPVWGRYVRDSRMTREQQDELKPLCTLADAKAVAEQLFGFKVSALYDLTTAEGAELIEKIRAVRAHRAATGWGADRLARKFGIGKTTAQSIIDRRSWRDVA